MQLVRLSNGHDPQFETYSTASEAIRVLRRIGAEILAPVHESKLISSDIDGVIGHDDNAVLATEIIAGEQGKKRFRKLADLNIQAVKEGHEMAYCWYAPTIYTGDLLKGLPIDFNRVIGRHLRRMPGVEHCVQRLKDQEYEFEAFTAGHQQAAEMTCRPLDVKVTGTRLGVNEKNDRYDGTVSSFIGGVHKRDAVLRWYNGRPGAHIGDGYSDLETLEAVEHSIGFNPSCLEAFVNSRIVVIGTSYLGMFPLFDTRGTGLAYSAADIPHTVVIQDKNYRQQKNEVDELYALSRDVKEIEVEKIVSKTCTREQLTARIRKDLNLADISIGEREVNMSDEEFDQRAKETYRAFIRRKAA